MLPDASLPHVDRGAHGDGRIDEYSLVEFGVVPANLQLANNCHFRERPATYW